MAGAFGLLGEAGEDGGVYCSEADAVAVFGGLCGLLTCCLTVVNCDQAAY